MTTLLLAFAAPFLCAAVWLVIWLVPFFIRAYLDNRAYRRHQKWVDGLCQGEPPK